MLVQNTIQDWQRVERAQKLNIHFAFLIVDVFVSRFITITKQVNYKGKQGYAIFHYISDEGISIFLYSHFGSDINRNMYRITVFLHNIS